MTLKKLMISVASIVALGASGPLAYSQTQSAMAGHGWPTHNDTCFASSFAQMTNTCVAGVGVQRLLIIPAQISHSGATTVSARASGNGSDGSSKCQAIGIDVANGGVSFSAIVSTTNSSASQNLAMGSVSPPVGGTMHFECFVAEGGGRVININFI
jgi:hypothetical protein